MYSAACSLSCYGRKREGNETTTKSHTEVNMATWLPWQVRRRFEAVAYLVQHKALLLDHEVTTVPHDKKQAASSLGWVGYFFSVPGGSDLDAVLPHVDLPDMQTFEARMAAIDPGWNQSVEKTASALLKYSERHHADPSAPGESA